jgi:predicted alpha/beta hydrolase family esterase
VRWHIDRCEEPAWIVAHGFGCLAAVRAAASASDKVEGALVVAPVDPDQLRLSWMLPEEPLGFPSAIVASSNDPHMRLSKAAFWAGFWSSDFVNIGRAGSIDPASGFGPWPQGLALLDEVRRSPAAHLRHVIAQGTGHYLRST